MVTFEVEASMSEKLVKVTEIVGTHQSTHDFDVIDGGYGPNGVDVVTLTGLLPDGAEGKRGTWRFEVTFTPESD
jgi:hypothetical protein